MLFVGMTFQEHLKNLSNEESKMESFSSRKLLGVPNVRLNIDSCTCNKCQELFQDKIFNVHMLSPLR